MKKVLLLSLSLVLGFSAFAQQRASRAQQRLAKNDLVAVKVDSKKVVAGKDNVVSMAPSFVPQTQKSVVTNRYDGYLDGETMWTYYDLQSNGWCSNRMYQFTNGDVAITGTWTHQNSQSPSTRGTGYNFYRADVDDFDAEPDGVIENYYAGWPSIAQWGATGEILMDHGGGAINCWVREVAGEGEWQYKGQLPKYPEGFPTQYQTSANYPTWPRVVTTGDNHNIIHVIGDIQVSVSDTETHNYQVYFRSEDAENWTIDWSPLAMDDAAVDHFGGDAYSLAGNGHTVAMIYADDLQSHLLMYKSSDDGLTWQSYVIWDNPYAGYDWETDSLSIFTDTLFGPSNVAIAVDNNGVAHVAMNTYEYIHDEIGNTYTTFRGRGVDGIFYWNDTQDAPIKSIDGNPHHALRLWWPDPENPGYVMMEPDSTKWIGYLPMYQDISYESDYFYIENDYFYKFRSGQSGMPALSIDPMGNIACAFSSPCTARTYTSGSSTYYLRSIYTSYYNVDEGYWHQVEDDLTDPEENFLFEPTENIFTLSAANTVNPGEFWFGFMSDDKPGLFWGSNATQTTGTQNIIHGVKVMANEEFVSVPESTEAKDVVYSIYPNPATDNYIVVESAQKADATITIVNLVGQTVMKFNKSLNLGANTINIDLQSGIYFCTVSANGFDRTMKFVVK